METETEGVSYDDFSADSDNNGAGTDNTVPDSQSSEPPSETDVVSDTGGFDDEQPDTGADESGGQTGTDSGAEETAEEGEETSDGSGDGAGVDETESAETETETESDPSEAETESGSADSGGAAEGEDGSGLTTEQYQAIVQQIDQLHADNEQLHYDFGIVASFLIFFAIEMAFRYLYRLFRIFI